MAKRKNAPAFDGLLTLPVSFGNFSAGDKTCRLGCTVSRGDLKLALADKNLCEKRLALVCIAKPDDEHPDQGRLNGMENEGIHRIEGSADVKGLSVSGDQIGFGLTFALRSVSVEELVKLAKRTGQLVIEGVEDIPESDGSFDVEDNGDE